MSGRRDRRLAKAKRHRNRQAQRPLGETIIMPTDKLMSTFERLRPPEAEGRHLTEDELDRVTREMLAEIVPPDEEP